MKYLFTFFISLFISLTAFSQVITLECNNTIIVVPIDELVDNADANIDWNGDGDIDEQDYIMYLSDMYGCNIEEDDEDNDWGDDEDNDWGDDEDNDW